MKLMTNIQKFVEDKSEKEWESEKIVKLCRFMFRKCWGLTDLQLKEEKEYKEYKEWLQKIEWKFYLKLAEEGQLVSVNKKQRHY